MTLINVPWAAYQDIGDEPIFTAFEIGTCAEVISCCGFILVEIEEMAKKNWIYTN